MMRSNKLIWDGLNKNLFLKCQVLFFENGTIKNCSRLEATLWMENPDPRKLNLDEDSFRDDQTAS